MSLSIKKKYLNPIGSLCWLGLFFMLILLCGSFVKSKKLQQRGVKDTFTVARIFEPGQDGFVKVAFTRSQRFFRIKAKTKKGYIELLRHSASQHFPVVISRESEKSDIIVRVAKGG